MKYADDMGSSAMIMYILTKFYIGLFKHSKVKKEKHTHSMEFA